MQEDLLNFLACPACGVEKLVLDADHPEAEDIETGRITCRGCGQPYPIVNGIPRMLPEAGWYFGQDRNGGGRPQTASLAKAMRLTVEHYSSYQGRVYASVADSQDNEAILEARTGLQPAEFHGRICLDAGCGVGRMSRVMARLGAAVVVGIDAGFAIDEARRRSADLPNVHWIQGDLLRPPLRKGLFERVVSLGVLHHTVEPDRAFRSISDLARDDGTVSVYLYARTPDDWRSAGTLRALLSQARFTLYTEPIRRAVVRLPNSVRHAFCRLMWVRRRMIELSRRGGAVGRLVARALEFATPADPYMPLESGDSNIARLYDVYSTPYNYTHGVLEVVDWYERSGRFREVYVSPYRVSITGWLGTRGDDEPLSIRYLPARSFAEIAARGIRADESA